MTDKMPDRSRGRGAALPVLAGDGNSRTAAAAIFFRLDYKVAPDLLRRWNRTKSSERSCHPPKPLYFCNATKTRATNSHGFATTTFERAGPTRPGLRLGCLPREPTTPAEPRWQLQRRAPRPGVLVVVQPLSCAAYYFLVAFFSDFRGLVFCGQRVVCSRVSGLRV